MADDAVVTAGPRVAPSWTGVLLALGGIVAAVGTFLVFEKITFDDGGKVFSSDEFTGLGSRTETGEHVARFSAGNAGVVVLAAAAAVLVVGVLVLARRGRLWAGVVALVAATLGLVMAVAALSVPRSDAKDLNARLSAGYHATASAQIGAQLAAAGVAAALLAAILAIVLRKSRA